MRRLSKLKTKQLHESLDSLNLEWYEQNSLVYARGTFSQLLDLKEAMKAFGLTKITLRYDIRESEPTVFFSNEKTEQYVAMKLPLNEEEKDILLNL